MRGAPELMSLARARRALAIGEPAWQIFLATDGRRELIAPIAGVVGAGFTGQRLREMQGPANALNGILSVDPLTQVLVYHQVVREREREREPGDFQGEIEAFHTRVAHLRLRCGQAATEDGASTPLRCLLALHARTSRLDPAELNIRDPEHGPRACGLLNEINLQLLRALLPRPPGQSEEDVLVQLRDHLRDHLHDYVRDRLDSALPADAAARFIRNGIDIALETVRTRHSLPAPYRLQDHDGRIFHLFMDAEHWRSPLGRYHFENELGYMAGCLRAWRHLLSLASRPLTADALCRVHDLAVQSAFRRAPVPLTHPFQLGYRQQAVSFPLIEGRNHTPLGYEEFLASPDSLSGWVSVGPHIDGVGLQLTATAMSAEACREKAAEILSDYYQELAGIPGSGPGAEDRRLLCIVHCCQRLDRHHLFADANIRTIGYLCLNKLLLDLGMAPTVLDYPKVLDMCAASEIVEGVRRGQQRYRSLQSRARALDLDAEALHSE